jgi:hypothetical protein
VQHNQILADYYKNRGKDPFGLLQKLKELAGENGLKIPGQF